MATQSTVATPPSDPPSPRGWRCRLSGTPHSTNAPPGERVCWWGGDEAHPERHTRPISMAKYQGFFMSHSAARSLDWLIHHIGNEQVLNLDTFDPVPPMDVPPGMHIPMQIDPDNDDEVDPDAFANIPGMF